MSESLRKNKWAVLVAVFAILLSGAVAVASDYYLGHSIYGYMNVYFNADGYRDATEYIWAYYLQNMGVADYAWIYAYIGMGLDVLPYFGDYKAYYVPNLYLTYQDNNALGWSNGYNIWLNSKYLTTVDWSNWLYYLGTEAWYTGSTVTHEMSHVFYRQVTGRSGTGTYWDNFVTESLAHYVGNCVWPWQDPSSSPPFNWQEIGVYTWNYWSWNSSGWGSIGTWNDIASTYNYGYTYGWEDRLHFWAFGYMLANYYDLFTGYTGLMGSNGYSPLSSWGWGGSWNVAMTLWAMGEYRWGVQDSLALVYSTPGYWYSSSLTSMSYQLDQRYYWYWWLLSYYS